MPDAPIEYIVTAMRPTRPALALLLVLLVTTGSPLFASGSHTPCSAQPECSDTTRMMTCCCCHDGSSVNQPGLTLGRVEIGGDQQPAVSVAPVALASPSSCHGVGAAEGLRLHLPAWDFVILFADLRL